MRPLLLAFALAALAVMAGCGGARYAPIDSVVPDFMEGDLELAVIPAPVDARLDRTLVATNGFHVVAAPGRHLSARRWRDGNLPAGGTPIRIGSPSSPAVREHLARHGVVVEGDWLGREGYVLDVRREEDALVIAVAAGSSEGVLWGLETLRQISWRAPNGTFWVRLGTVRDRPAFVDRGGADPRLGESLYKASFVWASSPALDLQRRGRWRYVPVWQPGEALDASEAAVQDAVQFFEEWAIRGSRGYGVRFDGLPFRLDRYSGTAERFDSDYVAGLVSYLEALRAGIRGFDGGARVLWLPQTYHRSHPQFDSFAASVREAGGIPAGVGLVVSGPRVLSERIRAEDVEAIRRAFGATGSPALVWDRVDSARDFTPVTGRDPELRQVASGVFGDGTMIKRITRLDWSWNPTAYQPERSLRLAVRELAGPSAYRETLALVEALGDGTGSPDPARLRALLNAVEAAWGDPEWRRDLRRDAFRQALRSAVQQLRSAGS